MSGQTQSFRRQLTKALIIFAAVYGGYEWATYQPEATRQQRIEQIFGKDPSTAAQGKSYIQKENERQSNLNALLERIKSDESTSQNLATQVKLKPVNYVTPATMDHLDACKEKFKASSPGMVLECMKTKENQRETRNTAIKRIAGGLAGAFAVVALVGWRRQQSKKRDAANKKMEDSLKNSAAGVSNSKKPKRPEV